MPRFQTIFVSVNANRKLFTLWSTCFRSKFYLLLCFLLGKGWLVKCSVSFLPFLTHLFEIAFSNLITFGFQCPLEFPLNILLAAYSFNFTIINTKNNSRTHVKNTLAVKHALYYILLWNVTTHNLAVELEMSDGTVVRFLLIQLTDVPVHLHSNGHPFTVFFKTMYMITRIERCIVLYNLPAKKQLNCIC